MTPPAKDRAMLSTLRERRLLWPAVMTLVGVLVTVGLGIWQWQRLAWKTELIATIEARTTIAALPPEAWPNLKCRPLAEVGLELSCEYMKVTLSGTWDHARERHVFIFVPPRSGGIGGPGYWIFTPLRLDSGGEIYVNRGFVPEALKQPEQRRQGQSENPVQVVGLLRSAEARARFSGANDVAHNVWYVRSPVEFLESASGGRSATAVSSPGPDPRQFYVDQTAPSPSGEWPLPLAGKIELPNRHLEYALTWFALAATLLGVYAAYFISNWKNE